VAEDGSQFNVKKTKAAHWKYSAQNGHLRTQSSKEDYYAVYRTLRTVLPTPRRAKDAVKDHDKGREEAEIQK